MTYLTEMDPQTGLLPADMDRKKGSELHDAYAQASPFPHIVIEDFLPRDLLDQCLAQFPGVTSKAGEAFDRDQERNKSQFSPDELDGWFRTRRDRDIISSHNPVKPKIGKDGKAEAAEPFVDKVLDKALETLRGQIAKPDPAK